MPNIYVPNKGPHDYTDAERYGTLIFVTKGEQNRFALGTMARRWAKVLLTSSPDDYLLLSSLTHLCCVGCSLFALRHGRLNILLFRNGKYVARTLQLSELFTDIQREEEGEDDAL